MVDRNPNPSEPTNRKAVLFCGVCGHEAPYDGGWSVTRAADSGRRDVECPDCGETVVSQPRFDSGSRGHPLGLVRPLLQFVNTLIRDDAL